MEKLDEKEHHNTNELVKVVNKLIEENERLNEEIEDVNFFLGR